MTDEFAIVRHYFMSALEKQGLEAQLRYVAEQCGDTPDLLAKLEEMLGAHHETEGFLASEPDGASTELDTSEKIGRRIGPYKLLQQIGEGGMGVVYMAEQTEPVERRVALKIIKPGMDSRQVIARFEAERQALAMMDHPNIARVIDAGATESGRPFFAMELVNGLPITEFCDQHQLNARQRLELFIPVCQAVQHAHQKGIIHRDLKPSNILIAMYDDRPVPKVIDFGVAKAVGQRLTDKTMFTALGQIVGTIDYMSPEQVQRNQLDIDTRSDIYSLGVVLYELLAGEKPFDCQRLHAAAFEELLRIIREEEPPRPSIKLGSSQSLPAIAANRRIEPQKLSALMRGELDWIVMKALEKDRARRYETVNDFAEDVRRYLDNESVLACPPSRMYRARKFIYRNKFLLIASALVFLVLIVGIAGTGWQVYRATQAERLSLEKEQEAIHSAQEAIAAAGQSKRSLMKAHEAVDRLLTRIGEDRLTNVPHSEQIRRGILEDALEIYRGLLSDNSDDIDLLLETANASARVSDIYDWLGESSESMAYKQEAIRIYEKLMQLGDSSPQLVFRLAQVLSSTKKQEMQIRAMQLSDELLASDSRNPEYLALRFELVNYLATHLVNSGNYLEAMKKYESAIQFAETLEIDWPQETVIPLCQLYEWYSNRLEAHPSRTIGYYQTARQHLEAALNSQPENRKLRESLASLLSQISQNYRSLGRTEDDQQAGALSVTLYEALCQEFPDVRSYQRSLTHALVTHAWSMKETDPQRRLLFERGFEIVDTIFLEDSSDVGAAMLSSRTAAFLGILHLANGRRDQAKEMFLRALKRREELVQLAPNSLATISGSSAGIAWLGNSYSQGGQFEKAIEFYIEEARFRESLLQRGSTDGNFIKEGIRCLTSAVGLLDEHSQFVKAAKTLSETLPFYHKREHYLGIEFPLAVELKTVFRIAKLYHQAGDLEQVKH